MIIKSSRKFAGSADIKGFFIFCNSRPVAEGIIELPYLDLSP